MRAWYRLTPHITKLAQVVNTTSLPSRVFRVFPLLLLLPPPSVTRAIDASELSAVEKELQSIWNEMYASLRQESFPTRTGKLCDWCSFKNRCPAFAEEREGGTWGEV